MDKVLMDTNGYRYLVAGKSFEEIEVLIDEVKEKERANNIETLFAPVVAQELLAHVADKSDPSYEKCLKAIKAQYLHNGDHEKFSMLATHDLQISRSFFNAVMPSKVEHNLALGQILYYLAINPSEETFNKFQDSLNKIRKEVIDNEARFVCDMQELVLRNDPTATNWHMFKNDPKGKVKFLKAVRSKETSLGVAKGYLITIHNTLLENGLIFPHNEAELPELAEKFVTVFPEPIALYKEVIERFTRHPFDMTQKSRANFLWDIELMFNMGDHTIDGSRLFFITEDDTMVRTALRSKKNLSVYTFNDYMDYLGLSHLRSVVK